MPDQPTLALAHEEDQTIFDVLSRLLILYPAQLTDEELTRELTVAADDFASQDAIHRAIRDLTAVGLIHRHGSFIWPSRAAARFWELVNAGM